ncbi:MAG: Holliday junction resolvase RuvX [Armatimonadota bacterium]
MRILALDFGERRIGVAASDPLGLTAQPVTVIERASLDEDLARIKAVVEQRKAEKIVLGLPLNMDGTAGPQARLARRFAARLRRALGLEVVLWDERLTTVEADRSEGQGLSEARRESHRRRRDAVAAAVILQDYLNAQQRSAAS